MHDRGILLAQVVHEYPALPPRKWSYYLRLWGNTLAVALEDDRGEELYKTPVRDLQEALRYLEETQNRVLGGVWRRWEWYPRE